MANGEVGQLRLGFTGTSMLNPLIPKCVRYFQQQYPKVNLKLEEANTLLLIDSLLEDRLDVAIIRSPRNMPDSLILQELLAEPLIAALPSESFQLDDVSQEIDLTALRELDFIVSPPSVSAGLLMRLNRPAMSVALNRKLDKMPRKLCQFYRWCLQT